MARKRYNIPLNLERARHNNDTNEVMRLLQVDNYISPNEFSKYNLDDSHFVNSISSLDNIVNRRSKIAYFDDEGQGWVNSALFDFEVSYYEEDSSKYSQNYTFNKIDEAQIVDVYIEDEWKPLNKLPDFDYVCLQDREKLEEILNKNKPYAYQTYKNLPSDYAEIDVENFLILPYLETLIKADYKFVELLNFQSTSWHGELTKRPNSFFKSSIGAFNRLCQNGNNPKEIFKTSKNVYKLLKDERSLEIWDIYRKMDKFGRMNSDTLKMAYETGMTNDDLKYVYQILNKTYQDKPIFTWDTLMNYLNRIDMYEAIDRREGMILLGDYLSMCSQLNIKPCIDGDSLKREHDVTARIFREKRNQIVADKFNKNIEELHKYDYKEDVFFARAFNSYDDLLDEAKQQHNCVACYADRIASGKTKIWVVRETAHPERSLATVEPKSDFSGYRQKLLAYNKPIRNKALTEFLDRCLDNAQEIEQGIKQSQTLVKELSEVKEIEPMLDKKDEAKDIAPNHDFGHGRERVASVGEVYCSPARQANQQMNIFEYAR